MKADKNNSIGRFRIIMLLVLMAGLYIVGTALRTMLPPTSLYWQQVDKKFTNDNRPIPANRGDILSADGLVLSGTVPEYRLTIDFKVVDPDSAAQARTQHFRDSVLDYDLDSIATGLARIFPDRDASWFRHRIQEGRKRGRFAYRIYPRHASYIQLQECRKLPLLRESSLKGGFHAEEILQRRKPYGQLASRTLGDLYRDSDAAKFGLELSYDSILRGKPGICHRARVRNSRLTFVDKEPENGHDLRTTIDVGIQDAVDNALRKKLYEVGGEVGVAIVMEVKTGDVKAISNLTRGEDGNYYEMMNNAVCDLMEPGSTFKTASIMVALEDGKITLNKTVDCAGGVYMMHGRPMKDHNWRKGGYGTLKVEDILGQSSNIGVSRIIDEAYSDDPQKFVDGLRREGVGLPLDLPFPGKGEPRVPRPDDKNRYWSKTDLPWMSIGYVTMLPPISTLTFYNAIANGGRMVKPRFVTAELQDGRVVREFPTEVIKEQICSPHTLRDIQYCLEHVVSGGLGKKAGNGGKYFKVSGKTGTAQIASAGGAGYHSGVARYMVSFCGYFPSDEPRYSCLVCIKKTGLPASGGGQCGPVFREISQFIMSKGMYRDASLASDSTSVYVPTVKRGPKPTAKTILSRMGVDARDVDLAHTDSMPRSKVPSVIGMGARDAVNTLQQRGLKVRLSGKGRVKQQDMPEGTLVVKGKTISLTLEQD